MTKRFSFYFSDGDELNAPEFPVSTSINVDLNFDDNSTWDLVLTEFIKFLGHAWGYDISDSVSYEAMSDKVERILREAEERDAMRGRDDCDYDDPEGYTLK